MTDRPTDGESNEAVDAAYAQQRLRLTRRTFLVGAAGAVGVGYVRPNRLLRIAFPAQRAELAADITPINPINGIIPIDGGGTLPDLVISAERDSDLVLLDFAFYGFTVQAGSPPSIVPTSTNNVIVVQFPPQAVGEGVYPWAENNLPVDPPPILSDLSGPSRLCFSLPDGGSIALPTMTVSDLLDWGGWDLLVPPVAQVGGSLIDGRGRPVPTEPTEFETSIEFPYALFLAPTVDESSSFIDLNGFSTGFTSRTSPLVSPAGVVDLWSTSLVGALEQREIPIGLGGQSTPTPPYVPQVSAVWAVDYAPPTSVALTPNATPESVIEYDLEVIQ